MIAASFALAFALLQAATGDAIPPASEVTYRHEIYRDADVTAYLLEIPPGHATQMHRHDKDILSVFFGGRTTATFEGRAPFVDVIPVGAVRYRTAGFAHATRNDGDQVFRSVILEFNGPQGERQSTAPAGDLFCTVRFCVEDLTLQPQTPAPDRPGRGLLIAVSDASLGSRDAVVVLRSGAVAPAVGEATQRGAGPARVIRVTFRQPGT